MLDGKGGEFMRWSTDREFRSYEKNLRGVDGVSPASVALEAAERYGNVALLDAGCGTARALWGMRGFLQSELGTDVPIRAVGLNIDDFSDESSNQAVRRAIVEEDIEYVLGDIGGAPVEGDFDVITCYEVLVHMPSWEATLALGQLMPLLRDGGSLFCTILPWQDKTVAYEDLLESADFPYEKAFHRFGTRKVLRVTRRDLKK